MTVLLLKLCKIPKRPQNAAYTTEERARLGAVAGGAGICTNLLLAIAKFIAGGITGSVSVTADAANNLSDAGSSLLTLVGFHLSGKPADKHHPFGHARYEYLTGLAISILIILLGLSFLKESILNIIHQNQSVFSWISLAILGVSIAVKLWQCFFYRKLARLIDSESLTASASDSLNDVIMTSVVLLGGAVRRFSGWEIDGWIGCGVAVFILISGIRLVLETADPLLGTAPDPKLVHQVQEEVLSYPGILGVHDLMIHSYGAGKLFASLHAEVNAKADLIESHDLIDNIEENAGKKLGLQLVIHLDPVTLNDPQTDELHKAVGELIHGISPKLTYHDFRVVFGSTHNKVIFDLVVPTEFALPDDELVALLTREIKEVFPTAVPKIKIDRDYANFLRE